MDHLTSFILIYIYIVIIDNTIYVHMTIVPICTYYPVDGLDLCNSAGKCCVYHHLPGPTGTAPCSSASQELRV